MTRLYYEIIKDIPQSLAALDNCLMQSTGHNLFTLASRTMPISSDEIAEKINNYTASVVSITSGAGVIPGFAKGVAAILKHIGLKVLPIQQNDITGIGEAFKKGADIFFAADDRKFLAFNLNNRKVVDNAWATAVGFTHALAAAVEMTSIGLCGQEVIVLGLGPVGIHAVYELQKLGAQVWVYDTNFCRMKAFTDLNKGVRVAENIKTIMNRIDYVYDATPASEFIDENMIRPETIISCPGVPHGLTKAALDKIGPNFIHDKLPLGVAVMALQCIFKPGD